MLSIPLKFTAKADLTAPINKFLVARYKDEGTKHADAVAEFQGLRNNIASVAAASEAARDALVKYYAQTTLITSKIPVSDGGNGAKLSFTWTDSLRSRKQFTHAAWAFEQANVLYNLAAVESQLAACTPRDSPAGIEGAGRRFCAAAGILTHVRDVTLLNGGGLVGSLPIDLTRDGLSALIALLLAQGQACFYEMARARNMKNETCARLAGHAGDLYRNVLKALPEATWAEIDAEFPWSHYARLYSCCFDAASFWQMAQKAGADAAEKADGYGVEVAWLSVAENACRFALESVRGAKLKPEAKASIDTSSASALLAQVSTRRAEAESDNLKIYLNPVPKPADLPAVPRAELAKLGPMPELAPYTSGSGDLFAGLVPAEVAASIALLDAAVDEEIGEAKRRGDGASEAARSALAGMGLPGSLDAAGAGECGIPAKLWERVARVAASGGLRELETLAAANASAAEGARRALDDAEATLDDEAAGDASFRAQYGDRWTAAPSSLVAAELRGELAKYRKVADVAGASDGSVAARLAAARSRLGALSAPRTQLEAGIPSVPLGAAPASGSGGEAVEGLRSILRTAVAELTSLLLARDTAVAGLKAHFDRGAAVRALAATPGAEQAAKVPSIVSSDAGLASTIGKIDASVGAQAALLERIGLLHERYVRSRAADERVVAREAALQGLSNDVASFEELLSHLREGAEFYRNLKGHADALLTTCRDHASARSLQQREALLELRAQAAALSRQSSLGGSGAPAGHSPYGMPGAGASGGPDALAAHLAALHLQQQQQSGGGGGGAAFAVPLPPAGAPMSRQTSLNGPSTMLGANAVQPTAYNPFEAQQQQPQLPSLPPVYPGSASPLVQPASYPSSSSSGPIAYPPGYPGAGAQHYYSAGSPSLPPQGYGAQQQQQQQHYPTPMGQGGQARPGYGGPLAAPAGDSPQLRQLTMMGFEREQAARALAANNGNVEASVNCLISGGAGPQ